MSKQDVDIDQKLTYSLSSESFNKPLRITNHSDHIYVFKIKTNQKTVISMQLTHDFIKPHSQKEISIKLAEKPNQMTPLKLELNYTIPTDEDYNSKDSKMTSYPKQAIFKRIVTIKRDDNAPEFKPKEEKQEKKQEKKQQKKPSPQKDHLSQSMNSSVTSYQEQYVIKPTEIKQIVPIILSEPVSFIKVVSQQYKINNEPKLEQSHIEITDKTVQVIKQENHNNIPIPPPKIQQPAPQIEDSQDRLSSSQRIFVSTFSESMQICESEPFKQQPSKEAEKATLDKKTAEKIIADLNEQISNEKEQIQHLRSQQQPNLMKSIRSFQTITLFIIFAFSLGSFSNWLLL